MAGSVRLVFLAQTLGYLQGGGHFWVYLNWALGFYRAGAQLTWLEVVSRQTTPEQFARDRLILENRLRLHGLPISVAFISEEGQQLSSKYGDHPTLEELGEEGEILVTFRYSVPESVTRVFRRSALVDIDPGLLQHWITQRNFPLAQVDYYFTISSLIGQPGNPIPTLGLSWIPTCPCVDTVSWPKTISEPEAPYTTVTHWEAAEYVVEGPGSYYVNTKKEAFQPYLTLPQRVAWPLELAMHLHLGQEEEVQALRNLGWRIRPSQEVSGSTEDYQSYIQKARGEFSVCKPSYAKMQSGWISDRTLCFLASGKPVVVQYTGPVRLPLRGEGFLRFQNLQEAVECLGRVESDYAAHSAAARHLAETVFDARVNAEKFLAVVLE